MPTHEGDVIKLWGIVEKLSIDIVFDKNLPSILDRDKKSIFFLLKKWAGFLLISVKASLK
jgi:hypothetical protein